MCIVIRPRQSRYFSRSFPLFPSHHIAHSFTLSLSLSLAVSPPLALAPCRLRPLTENTYALRSRLHRNTHANRTCDSAVDVRRRYDPCKLPRWSQSYTDRTIKSSAPRRGVLSFSGTVTTAHGAYCIIPLIYSDAVRYDGGAAAAQEEDPPRVMRCAADRGHHHGL